MFVKDLMTRKVFTLRADQKALEAHEIMDWAHVRHVPVVDGEDHVLGLVNRQDLLRAALARISSRANLGPDQQLALIPLDAIWERHVRTVSPEATVRDAARLMRAEKLSCLPVVEGGKLVGILTDHDMLKALEASAELELVSVEKVSPGPFSPGTAGRS